MKIIYTPCLGLIFYFGSSRIAANGSGGFAGAGIAEFGSWIRGFLRISCSAEVSQAFVIFEGNVQLWRNQHFWFWFFWKSGTNRASHVEHARLRQQVLEPIAVFTVSSPEDITTIANSQMTKWYTQCRTVKIFLHLSQLPALHCVLKFN